MIIKTTTLQEFHENGTLAWEETRSFISPLSAHIYADRMGVEGEQWIRVGLVRKWFDNGQLAWTLEYNQDGSISNKKYQQWRKDGTLILF